MNPGGFYDPDLADLFEEDFYEVYELEGETAILFDPEEWICPSCGKKGVSLYGMIVTSRITGLSYTVCFPCGQKMLEDPKFHAQFDREMRDLSELEELVGLE